jgi:hypothetical protein
MMRINIEIRNTCHGGILSDICRETGQKCRYGKNNSAFLSITILYFQVLFMLNRLIAHYAPGHDWQQALCQKPIWSSQESGQPLAFHSRKWAGW